MTAEPAPHSPRFVELSATELRARLPEALDIYIAAMEYGPGTAETRTPMWLAHMLRTGWRCIAAIDRRGALLGICYGYRGQPGQWWHEQVRRGLHVQGSDDVIDTWMPDYYELTELHVLPSAQGHGIGERLLRYLLADNDSTHVLLSTPEGTGRAWRLYRRLGFHDVLRDYLFLGDPRPFAVLGRNLPLG
ncbi:MAG: GNAT family N-acetyltransferase [Sciscionella sp.]